VKHKLQVLKNGLRLVTIPLPVKSVTIEVMVSAGSRYETEKNNGISHFAEHLFFKGTKKRPTAHDIAAEVDSFGGAMNAGTGKEQTSFFIKTASKHLDHALEILIDILTNSKFDPKEIDKERGVVLEEINMYEDLPMKKVGEVFESLLYASSPLGQRIIGKRKNIKQLERKDFLSYLERFYWPERMVVAIAGGVDNAVTLRESPFGHSRRVTTAESLLLGLRKQSSKVGRSELKIEYKKTEQAHFCLGVRTFERSHPDRYVLTVLATILGGSMSSRLFEEVREKRGLAYYIKTWLGQFHETGYLMTQAGTDIKKIDEAVKVILNEYRKITIHDSRFTNHELRKAKEYLKGHLILSLEDSQAVASLFGGSLLLEGKVRTPEKIITGIEKVTPADICRVAKNIFLTKNINLAIIGPYRDESKFEKLMRKF